MDWLKRLSSAFAAGCVGGIVLYIVLRFALAAGIVSPPEQVLAMVHGAAFPYQTVTWGGAWGFLFTVPLFMGMWWLRGIIVGLLVALIALFVFLPAPPAALANAMRTQERDAEYGCSTKRFGHLKD